MSKAQTAGDQIVEPKTSDAPAKPLAQPSAAEFRDQNATATVARTDATKGMESAGTLPKLILSDTAIGVESSLVNKALSSWTPDVASVGRVLGPMSSEDRRHLEKDYKEHVGRELRDDLKAKLSPADYAATLATLDRVDGRTNLAGAVNVALETTKVDPVEGQKLLRATLETLDGKRLAELDKQFKQTDGKGFLQTIMDDTTVSKENKDMLKAMVMGAQPRLAGAGENGIELDGQKYAVTGSDRRSPQDVVAMANSALQAQDLRMFKDAVGDQSPAAQAALKLLQQDEAFTTKFRDTFQTGKSDSEKQVAEDIRTEGRVSLATVIQGNSNVWLGLLDNPGNTDLALSNASAKERKDFTIGRELAMQAEKTGGAPEDLAKTPEQRDALAYYKKIEDAIAKSQSHFGDSLLLPSELEHKAKIDQRIKSVLEDQLMHGGKTLISQLAQTEAAQTRVNDSSQHTTDQLMGITERMSRDDYMRLHGNPAELAKYKEQLSKSLDTYATPDEKKRILDMVEAKANASSYEGSLGIKRSVTDVMADNTNTHWFGRADTYDNDKVVSRIASMSPEDAQRYKNNADGFRDKLDKFVKEQLTGSIGQGYLAEGVLKQVATTGLPPVLDPVQQVIKNKLDGADPLTQVRDLEKVLQDQNIVAKLKQVDEATAQGGGEFQRRMADPAFAESFKLAQAVRESTPNLNNPVAWKMALDEGRIPPGMKYGMGVPIAGLYEDFAKGSQERRDHVSLSADQRQILDAVVKQGGKLALADEMRSYVIGDGGNFKDFNDRLSKLSLSEREKLKNEYAEKYHSSLDNDYLGKVDKAHQIEYSNLLSTARRDGVQDFVDRTKVASVTGSTSDASGLTLDRSVQQNQSLLSEYSKMREKLPEEKQKVLDQFFSEAKFQAVKSEEAKAELIYNATIAAAMLASIPLTAGLSAGAMAALIPAAATAGAAYRVELMKAVQGGDFDDSTRNMVKQAIIGGVDGLLVAAPAALLGKGIKGAAELTPSTRAELEVFLKEVKGTGNVVATTGRDLVPSAARDLVPSAGRDLVPSAGRDLVPSVSRDLVPSASRDLIPSAGRDLVPSSGRDLVPSAGRDLVPSASRDLVPSAGRDLVPSADKVLEGEILPPLARPRLGPATRRFTTIEGELVSSTAGEAAAREAAARAAAATAARDLAVAIPPVVTRLAAAAALTGNAIERSKEVTPPPMPVPTAKEYQPNADMIKAATVRRGEGPWQSAERILKADGKHHSLEEVRDLTKAIQKVYGDNPDNPGMGSLKVKHNFVTETTHAYNDLVNTVKDARVKALLMQFAQ